MCSFCIFVDRLFGPLKNKYSNRLFLKNSLLRNRIGRIKEKIVLGDIGRCHMINARSMQCKGGHHMMGEKDWGLLIRIGIR